MKLFCFIENKSTSLAERGSAGKKDNEPVPTTARL